MNTLNKNKSGLVFGGLLGLWHLAWVILVLLDLAQHAINWIFRLHFITPPYTINEFNLGTAIMLIVVTSILGYIFGWLMAWLWNWLHKPAV